MQCIPILRPILREFTASLTSRNLQSKNRQSTTWVSKISGKRVSLGPNNEVVGVKGAERIALRDIPEEETKNWKRPNSSSTDMSEADRKFQASAPSSPFGVAWANETSDPRHGTSQQSEKSMDLEREAMSHSFISVDADLEGQKGLSPPPRRFP